ncbi:MAG: histone deacetylase family protein [Pirellulales bacterium]|nr:histone deacetylase family protein [Pirellulales bacterium]
MIRLRVVYGTCSLLSRDRMEQVREIFRRSFPRLAGYADRLPSLLRQPVRHGYRSALLVAEGALGRVDAFALVMHFDEINAVFLDFIATRPGLRGGGVGGALYEAVREFAGELGAAGLYMEVQPDDAQRTPEAAQLDEARRRVRFYEQYGARVVENEAYSAPVGDPPTCALLLFDGLGRTEPLGRAEARQAVERILSRRFAQVVDPRYVRRVVEAFRDDPVPLRPARLSAPRAGPRPVNGRALGAAFTLTCSPKHEIHHLRERGYFERPVRIGAIRETLDPTGLFAVVPPRPHGEKPLLAVHDPAFVHFLQTVCLRLRSQRPIYPDTFPIRRPDRRPKELPVQAGYYCLDTGTPLYPNAYMAARAAVDTTLTAADEIMGGRRLAYAVCRPPGHHAGKRFYGGFCYFNNAAIAAHYLGRETRVAILDVDFHHGNGTQDVFYDRGDVLTVSVHGHPDYAYPYFSGFTHETGEGDGLGRNRNFPLAPQADDSTYLAAFDRARDVVGRFAPDVLVVSLGFDILKGDPTGTFPLRPRVLRAMGRRLMELRRPLLIVQEGGYNLRNIRRGCAEFFTGCAEGT